MTERWPDKFVDHKDTDVGNDRWSNLRLATPSQNCANTKIGKRNISGSKGVHFFKNKWVVMIKCRGTRYYLGRFTSKRKAIETSIKKREELSEEFARIR